MVFAGVISQNAGIVVTIAAGVARRFTVCDDMPKGRRLRVCCTAAIRVDQGPRSSSWTSREFIAGISNPDKNIARFDTGRNLYGARIAQIACLIS